MLVFPRSKKYLRLNARKPLNAVAWGEPGKESNQMSRILTLMLPAAAVVVLALAGCGPKEKVADAAETPASVAEPYEAEAEPPAAEAPGQVLLETRCAVCHDLERVQKEKADRAGWEKIVDEMIGKGAKLDDAEKDPVLDYLVENYGP
jgi:cytochrome c5